MSRQERFERRGLPLVFAILSVTALLVVGFNGVAA